MGDHVIEVRVDDKIAYVVGDPLYVCGNSDYIVNFTFDADWADHEVKTARFIKNNKEYIDVVFSGSRCAVPIIENTTHVRIGVYAGNLCTTTAAIVNAQRSILCGSGTPVNPPDDVYFQIMENMDEIIARGTVSDEAIAGVVKDYLDENPVLGASPEEVAQIAANKRAIETMTAETIGAAPASHAADKNNPHGVTIGQIGAAPAGYGLGDKTFEPETEDLNDTTACGWYAFTRDTLNGPFDYGSVMVSNRYGSQVTQMAFNPRMGGHGEICVRHFYDGSWNEWEYINPPMKLGVEYRTTERLQGNPVYMKLVDCGALPNASTKEVAFATETTVSAFAVSGMALNGGESFTIPYGLDSIAVYAYKNRIILKTNGDYTSLHGYVAVKYTK